MQQMSSDAFNSFREEDEEEGGPLGPWSPSGALGRALKAPCSPQEAPGGFPQGVGGSPNSSLSSLLNAP